MLDDTNMVKSLVYAFIKHAQQLDDNMLNVLIIIIQMNSTISLVLTVDSLVFCSICRHFDHSASNQNLESQKLFNDFFVEFL